MRLGHVTISVKDMERSLFFYRDALGLKLYFDKIISGSDLDVAVMETNVKIRMVLLSDEAGSMIELLEWISPLVIKRPAEHLKFRSTGLVDFSLMVSDLEQLKESLAEKGIIFRTPIWSFSNVISNYVGPEIKVSHVVDPDGVQIELIQVIKTI